jgi:hypothetical protein
MATAPRMRGEAFFVPKPNLLRWLIGGACKGVIMNFDYDLVRERVNLVFQRQMKRDGALSTGDRKMESSGDTYRDGFGGGRDWVGNAMSSGKTVEDLIAVAQHQVAAMHAMIQVGGAVPAARSFGHLAGILQGLREAVGSPKVLLNS